MTYARDERTALCSLLDDLGPAAPTLCAGWSTRDLAAHLVIREHRPDAGGGLAGRGPLAGYTRRVQGKRAERTPFPRLVEILRQGPPRMSVFGLPGADELVNTVEFFVHHEDVRRAQPDWQPRMLDSGLADELWRRLRSARFFLRRVPVGLEFAREDAPAPPGGQPGQPGPRAAHREGADPGRDGDRAARRADHVGHGPDLRRAGPVRRQPGRGAGPGQPRLARPPLPELAPGRITTLSPATPVCRAGQRSR
jgi:uncharacterized protein (TIGR03085 family)